MVFKNIDISIVPQIIQTLVYDIAYVGVCYLLFTETMDLSETQETLITFVMGMMSSGLLQVNNFWFGSSSGSKQKTTLMGAKENVNNPVL